MCTYVNSVNIRTTTPPYIANEPSRPPGGYRPARGQGQTAASCAQGAGLPHFFRLYENLVM